MIFVCFLRVCYILGGIQVFKIRYFMGEKAFFILFLLAKEAHTYTLKNPEWNHLVKCVTHCWLWGKLLLKTTSQLACTGMQVAHYTDISFEVK